MPDKLKHRLKQSKFSSPSQEALLNLFVSTYVVRGKYDSLFMKFGITNPQYNVLRILKGAYPEGYPRCEIISRMIEPAPDVTRLVDKLIKEKYAERSHSSEDKRQSITKITRRGLKLLEEILPEIQALDLAVTKNFSETELNELSRLCEKLYGDDN